MVSIDTGKRYRMENPSENSKKAKFSSHYDLHCTISMQSSFFNENLSRLRVLFPLYPVESLGKALEDSHNSYDLAVHYIQKAEQDKMTAALRDIKAHNFIMALSSAKSLPEAYEIAKKLLENKDETASEAELQKENALLKEHIKTMANENKLLKRAVAKLHENIKSSPDKDKEIEVLRKELETERCKTFALLAQLTCAISSTELKLNRDLY
ncbi:hypothetical protein SteCoe_20202 [Stentor coeruleus]|uniref:CUE domain-containing protein n=1 Tax=Stentor coeruleus TaxID=5963 RepID=A0A1R2BSJ6_9CILI|nr:hypothetical protein SteCoe_20202 [Stentor coeruleus]